LSALKAFAKLITENSPSVARPLGHATYLNPLIARNYDYQIKTLQ